MWGKMNKLGYRIIATIVRESKARIWNPFFSSEAQDEIDGGLSLHISERVMCHTVRIPVKRRKGSRDSFVHLRAKCLLSDAK